MSSINLLYKDSFPINDYISIKIPTVGEILDDEDNYYSVVSMLTAMPIDMMVQLDSIGIDFSTINEYELFQYLFLPLQQMDTSLIFCDLDLSMFEPAVNEQNGLIMFENKTTGARIDRAIHYRIAEILRKIHGLKRDIRTPGNNEAKRYMLEKARKKLKRNSQRERESQLEQYIISVVNTPEFKYDYESVRGLSIYQFNQSFNQIIHKVDYNNRMFGIYSGTVSAKELPKEDLTWIKTT